MTVTARVVEILGIGKPADDFFLGPYAVDAGSNQSVAVTVGKMERVREDKHDWRANQGATIQIATLQSAMMQGKANRETGIVMLCTQRSAMDALS